MRAFLAVLVFVASVGCSFASRSVPAVWAGLKMDGLIMDRQNPDRVERLSFFRSGDVAATVGERRGQVAGIVYSWRVRGEWLDIFESRGKTFQRLRAIKVGKTQLVATDDSDRRITYTLTRR